MPPRKVELRRLADVFGQDASTTEGRPAFQAVEYPSLCQDCNGKRLGQRYDPVLAAFANDLTTRVRAVRLGVAIPSGLTIATRPAALARAVMGHVLAAEERKDPLEPLAHGTMADALRDFFLDESAVWPDDLYLSCWPYLGDEQVIVRGFGIMGVLNPRYEILVGELMKFRAVAFWLTTGNPSRSGYHFGLVPPQGSAQNQGVAEVELPLRGFPPTRWPEFPRDHEVIMGRNERTSFVGPAY